MTDAERDEHDRENYERFQATVDVLASSPPPADRIHVSSEPASWLEQEIYARLVTRALGHQVRRIKRAEDTQVRPAAVDVERPMSDDEATERAAERMALSADLLTAGHAKLVTSVDGVTLQLLPNLPADVRNRVVLAHVNDRLVDQGVGKRRRP